MPGTASRHGIAATSTYRDPFGAKWVAELIVFLHSGCLILFLR